MLLVIMALKNLYLLVVRVVRAVVVFRVKLLWLINRKEIKVELVNLKYIKQSIAIEICRHPPSLKINIVIADVNINKFSKIKFIKLWIKQFNPFTKFIRSPSILEPTKIIQHRKLMPTIIWIEYKNVPEIPKLDKTRSTK